MIILFDAIQLIDLPQSKSFLQARLFTW